MTATREHDGFVRFARMGASIVFLALVWEAVGRWGGIFVIPPFSVVLETLWTMLRSGELWGPTAGTLLVAGTGYAVGVVLGIAIGLAVGLSGVVRAAVEPIINAAYATPMAMFIPVIGVYLGLGFVAQVFLVVTFCVFIVIANTTAGVRAVPAEFLELGRALQYSYAKVVLRIVVPAAVPNILVGVRVSVARAVSGAITAELLLATSDLGQYLLQAGNGFDFERLVAGTLFVTLLGIFLVLGVYLIERRLVSWLPP